MTTNKCNIDADPELFRDLINKSNDSIFAFPTRKRTGKTTAYI
jgi:hypothetical protein